MTQGIYIKGRRPKSKKEIKEAIVADPSQVSVEATSWYGNEYDGPMHQAPYGLRIYFVGPDPYTNRRFYGSIEVTEKGYKVS
jgi:hypothetical protein